MPLISIITCGINIYGIFQLVNDNQIPIGGFLFMFLAILTIINILLLLNGIQLAANNAPESKLEAKTNTLIALISCLLYFVIRWQISDNIDLSMNYLY